MSTFAVEFGKAKTVAAFIVTELGAAAIYFNHNLVVSRYIALATVLLTTLAVYVVPNPIKGAVVADATVVTLPNSPVAQHLTGGLTDPVPGVGPHLGAI